MTNGPERRRTDTAAARRRRRELQQSFEQSHTARLAPRQESVARVLVALTDASSRLPVCDRAAKLHAALARLRSAGDTLTVSAAARSLLVESELALEDDPWLRFHRAATEAAATLAEAT